MHGIDHIDDADIVFEKLDPAVFVRFLLGDDEIGHVLWFYRFFYELQVTFMEKLVPLVCVAAPACAHLVFPRIGLDRRIMGHLFPTAERDDVIDGELIHAVPFTAVLAVHVVPLEDVEAGVNHLLSRNLVKVDEHDYAGQG